MKTKAIITLLVISLAFNLFFALGHHKSKGHAKRSRTFEGRSEIMADKLNLDEKQREQYFEFRKNFAKKRAERREANKEQFDKFWTEIIKDEPDQAVLDEFIQTSSIINMRQNFVERMQSLMMILNPEQRVLAVDLIRSRFQGNKKDTQAEAPNLKK